jgi:hypothetical protein
MTKPPTLEYSVANRVFVEVDIYGRAWPALLDTGASKSVVNSTIERWLADFNIPMNTRAAQLEMADGSRASVSMAVTLPIRVKKKGQLSPFRRSACYALRVGARDRFFEEHQHEFGFSQSCG